VNSHTHGRARARSLARTNPRGGLSVRDQSHWSPNRRTVEPEQVPVAEEDLAPNLPLFGLWFSCGECAMRHHPGAHGSRKVLKWGIVVSFTFMNDSARSRGSRQSRRHRGHATSAMAVKLAGSSQSGGGSLRTPQCQGSLRSACQNRGLRNGWRGRTQEPIENAAAVSQAEERAHGEVPPGMGRKDH
jgi:hypothetical protein